MASPEIRQARTEAEIAQVRDLFGEYLELLATDYGNAVGCAQGQEDLENFPQGYKTLFLGLLSSGPQAACGLKRINYKDVELGKLYCHVSGRGHGFGRKLTQAAIDHAKALGYARLVLSTEPIMKHAIKLYADMGFTPIEKYMTGHSGCSQFMGINL